MYKFWYVNIPDVTVGFGSLSGLNYYTKQVHTFLNTAFFLNLAIFAIFIRPI